MYHARSNLPCSRYTNEIYAQARSGRAKRATLLVYVYNYYVLAATTEVKVVVNKLKQLKTCLYALS